MKYISEIFIKNFKCLNCFSLDLNRKTEKETLNLNLLVGRNGAGKSTFLDALYEIATHTDNPDTIFQYYLKDENGELICGNCSPNNFEKIKEKPLEKKLWNKVIKFYTGNSNRNIEYSDKFTENFMTFERNDTKFVLSALFLSGIWNDPENKFIINEFKKIIFKNEATFEPIQIWLDIANYDKTSFELKEINCTEKVIENTNRLYINISELKNNIPVFPILNTLLKSFNADTDENNILKTPNTIIDTGFLYKKLTSNDNNKDLYIDETLSDGELGFIRRFALIMLMRELKGEENRSLLLLDEPETHFNENWKRHFIYLIKEALKDTYHDVFIATHSAMLITDVKRDELYHFELVNDKIKTFPVCLNTYATNIVDIGKALFDLEADIGEGSKHEIEAALKGVKEIKQDAKDEESISLKDQKEKLKELLKQVGPGEWRWKIRSKLNQIDKHENCPYLLDKNKEEKQ